MTVNRKPTGRAASVPEGLGWGALTAVVTTLLGCLITAKLIDSESLPWSSCGYAVMVILLLASWFSAMVAWRKIRRRKLVMCLASGIIYFMLLMAATAAFFGGRYSGVGETGLMIFCGSMLGVFSGFPGKSRRKPAKLR